MNQRAAAMIGKLGIEIDGSNGEIIQKAAPGAHVVKAFNTLNWRVMIDPTSTGGPISIPLVGDDAEATGSITFVAAASPTTVLDEFWLIYLNLILYSISI